MQTLKKKQSQHQSSSSKEEAASNIQMLQCYTESLPAELWLSKSPCPECTKQLIEAYEYREEKPTIHIVLDPVILEFQKKGFKVGVWDLQQESKDWQHDFEQSDNYQKYSRKIEEVKLLLAPTAHSESSESIDQLPSEDSIDQLSSEDSIDQSASEDS